MPVSRTSTLTRLPASHVLHRQGDADLALFCEFDGVAGEIHQHLPEAKGIGVNDFGDVPDELDLDDKLLGNGLAREA